MRPLPYLTVLAVLAVFVAQGAKADDAAFPVTIAHAFGTTVIEAKPERVVTVAWANHEVPLALGIVPVGMAAANFGDDDGDGVLPWVEAKLEELGAETPALFDEGDGIDFEGVAAAEPDVILAAYSGLSQADYDTLSKIAPVVAYPKAAWATDWREMIRLNSAGLGMTSEGEALIEQIEGEIAATIADYPGLQGKTALFVTHLDVNDLSVINFYTSHDTRVKFFADLGLAVPKSVAEGSKDGSFAAGISAEQADMFDDVDIVVTYGSQPLLDAIKVNQILGQMPVVRRDSIVLLGHDPVGTAANPTPLSISWVLKDYVRLLAEAVARAE